LLGTDRVDGASAKYGFSKERQPNSSLNQNKKEGVTSRTKGSLNHTTRDTKEFLNAGVKNEHPRIEAELLDLFETNKASYLNAITKLLPFITPKASEMHLLTPDTLSKMPSWFDDIPIEYAAPRT